jgi:hypothetical protein
MKDGNNFANDFVDLVNQVNTPQASRDLPAMHPTEIKEKFVNLAEEEDDIFFGGKQSNLINMPTGERHMKLARYNITQTQDIADYEDIQNKVIRGRVGNKLYVLLREQWTETKDGDLFITVKYMTIDMKDEKGKTKK